MYAQTMNNDVTLSGGENPLLAGRYQVVRPLGAGGMGSVYLVEDTQLDNKLFAVKMLPSILVANKRAYRQLKGEALVAMKLVHPNIMQIRAFEENNGNPFLVMDYIEGQTLDDYIADKGVLTEEETLQLLKAVAAALDYAHGEGVVHRDVNPANVMIRKDGRPFILDFGIAREMQKTMTRVTGKFSSGTLLYMSPEQLNGEPPASAQDVYSFAAMLYECLKGEPPFVRGQIEYQILNNPPPPLSDTMSSSLVNAVIRGLAKKPEERPETCGSMLNADGDIKSYTRLAIKLAIVGGQMGDYTGAFAAAQKADKDNSEIQYILGRCYQFGDGVEENSDTAMQWYRKAAERGHTKALFELGSLYRDKLNDDPLCQSWTKTDFDEFEKSFLMALRMRCSAYCARHVFAGIYVEGVFGRYRGSALEDICAKVDKGQTLELIRIAAEYGHSEAQYQLGCRYEKGDGVPQDYSEAAKWYREAAERSDLCHYAEKLGVLYKKGLGVKKDYNEAIKWYRKAVETCDSMNNEYALAQAYELAKKYSEAVEWYRKAAERGMADAQCKLGVMYSKGQGVSKDDTEACKWYLKAAEQGNVNAQHDLGGHYYLGKGVAQDYTAAAKWLRMSAEQGNADAQRVLGVMYMEGQGFEQNYEEAVAWFQKATQQGLPVAYFDLAAMYEQGNGVPKDTKKALELYLKSATLGDTLSQCTVARIFETGHTCLTKEECVSIDYVESTKWYQKAAEQGDAVAQYSMGVMYENGNGVSKDIAKAIEWYRKAAEQGNARAQVTLADSYVLDKGVTIDYAEAAKWYLKAAKQGIGSAQYAIGLLLQKDRGVDKNDIEAVKWFRKAAEQGYSGAQFQLGKCLSCGKGVERNQVEAVKWYSKAAEQGNAEAQYSLGLIYWCGNGVGKDEKRAIHWVRKAAEQGNSKAQDCLGLWYFEGMGMERDYIEAYKWYYKAAEQGEMASQYRLGEMYYSGIGVTKNDTEAAKWFKMLAERDHNSAQYALGVMYYNGEGVKQNYAEAIKWLNKSARGGNTDAQYTLGVLYENGDGTTKDTEKAMYWYRKAAEHGHEDAAKRLTQISAAVKQQTHQEIKEKRPQGYSVVTKRGSAPNTTSVPPDSQFSTGKKGEYRVDGVDYVDVSGKGLLGTMFSSFFAGLSGKGVVTGWDKMSGAWDVMKRDSESQRKRRK